MIACRHRVCAAALITRERTPWRQAIYLVLVPVAGPIITGTAGADTIDCATAAGARTINGLGGADTITGSSFADTINGGDDNDTMTRRRRPRHPQRR